MRKGQRVLWVVLAALVGVAGCEQAGGAVEKEPGGETAPVSVSKSVGGAADLARIGTDAEWPLNGSYTLTADITLTDWKPVGTAAAPFTGEFDGGEKTITVESFKGEAITASPYAGVFGYVKQGTIRKVRLAGSMTVSHDSSAAKALFAGGLAAYLAESTVEDCHSTAALNATSVQGPVYAGGLAGYGKELRISRCSTGGAVTAWGQGHNSSAGGVGGYLIKSTITGCSASGAVLLEAIPPEGATAQDYLYMIYAGGLVGYTGDGSLTGQCFATGAVTARSPYPYAGGLVGYNYGDLSGESDGAVIRVSSATGAVLAEAVINGLPYAGGLAGYTSQKGKLEDSYATGSVRAESGGRYAWAGGITASCANRAQVRRCYARGDVTAKAGEGALPFGGQPGITPGAVAGGIAGYVYWDAEAVVEHCAALNASVKAEGPEAEYALHRVIGRIDEFAKKRSNLGQAAMECGSAPAADVGADGLDGEDVEVPISEAALTALGWDFNTVWKMGGEGYPGFK